MYFSPRPSRSFGPRGLTPTPKGDQRAATYIVEQDQQHIGGWWFVSAVCQEGTAVFGFLASYVVRLAVCDLGLRILHVEFITPGQ